MMKKAAQEIRQGLDGHPQQTVFMGGTFPINTTAFTLWSGNLWPLTVECLRDYTFLPPKNGPYGTQGTERRQR